MKINKQFNLFILFVTLLIGSQPLRSETTFTSHHSLLTQNELSFLREILLTEVQQRKILDLDFRLLSGNDIVFEFSARNGQVLKDAPNPASLFRIASMSKPITAVAALILIERGLLDLDAPVSNYIESFSNMSVWTGEKEELMKPDATIQTVPANSPVLVRHLLTHTSGIIYPHGKKSKLTQMYHDLKITNGAIQTYDSPESLMARIGTIPLKVQPGQAWVYGMSVDVLGRVIEVASKQSLSDFLQKNIFEPLKMKDTYFFIPNAEQQRLLPLYTRDETNQLLPLPDGALKTGTLEFSADYAVNGPKSYYSGGGGLISTIDDYTKFTDFLAHFKHYQGAEILAPEWLNQMKSNQVAKLDIGVPGYTYGFGIGVRDNKSVGSTPGNIGELSWSGLFYTKFWIDPSTEISGLFFAQMQPDKRTDLYNRLKSSIYSPGQ